MVRVCTWERCERWSPLPAFSAPFTPSVSPAPHVAFLRAAMKQMGCPKPYNVGENVHCVSCPGQMGGGYHPPSQAILLCQNRIASQAAMTKTLSHEMIHAFDDCRADIDWTNCVHHACTEVSPSLYSALAFGSSCGIAWAVHRYGLPISAASAGGWRSSNVAASPAWAAIRCASAHGAPHQLVSPLSTRPADA